MREILFRGKRLDNGEWVSGRNIGETNSEKVYVAPTGVPISMLCSDSSNVVVMTPMVEVNPDTVGQYIGLTDKNGTKIFEGDILQTRRKVPKSEDALYRFVVKYGEYVPKEYCKAIYSNMKTIGFYCADGNKDFQLSTCSNCLEVIGNIHDNPELLGSGAAND